MSFNLPNFVILGAILFIWFLLGMIIVGTGICALTLPIVFPIVVKLGYDPIWFGVVLMKLLEIAAVTPPVGLNVFALKSVAGEETTIEEIYRGIWPFVVCDLIVLVLLILFPRIVLFLPDLMLK
jgi:TRAP-type C4-dicarboxylate transport system permease large subunit